MIEFDLADLETGRRCKSPDEVLAVPPLDILLADPQGSLLTGINAKKRVAGATLDTLRDALKSVVTDMLWPALITDGTENNAVLPQNKKIRETVTRAVMHVLADLPDGEGLHRTELWNRAQERHPRPEEDWETHVNDKTGPFGHVLWRTSELVSIGWLSKDGNGTWRLTGAGRWALREFPDLERWVLEVDRRYKRWKATRGRLEQAKRMLSSLPADSWVSVDDLTAQTGTSPGELVQHICGTRPEGWHRLREDSGAPPKDAHFTQSERALVDELVAADQLVGPEGAILHDKRLDQADAMRYFADAADPDEADDDEQSKRRAWLIRGSNVQGQNLVHSLWLPHGVCSLAASRLRDLPVGSNRETIEAAVRRDYAHASGNERSALALEFHAFLSRIRPNDIVLTNVGTDVYIGTIDGPASFTSSSGNRANLQRSVAWHNYVDNPLDYADDLPAEAATRLANPDASLIELTEFVGALEQLLGEEPEQPVTARGFSLPDPDAALADKLHFKLGWLRDCVELLRVQPQLVFYGPPGTGKTHTAQVLAEHLVGGKPENVQLVQFHPAYSYEDFFEGFRPRPAVDGRGATFELTPGPLRRIADAARKHPDEPFVLIVDELNRGNLAKIFGELYFLLEYRGKSVNLLYGSDGGLGFSLPPNLVIPATMNTADRSIALVDAAMRRRFWFMEMYPDTEPVAGLLSRWLKAEGHPDDAALLIDELNSRIADRDFRVGPSYLISDTVQMPRGLERVWQHQILPLLVEHHYGVGTDVNARYGLGVLREHLGLGEAVAGAEGTGGEE
ncbi:hypothetical protein GCM10009799_29960 [Nocardiopsis rhodophaea]|uniref:ATPase dynein-related AAA domain-containing protein n=1 Tax=Nocardiopsis rhodophaea TaxID=280238 RepID=A0ABN2T775_9ACTN